MFLIMFLISLFIIVCLIFMYLIAIYNRYQNYIIRINEAEANIDSTLRKRFDLLNKSIGIIKANAEVEENALEIVVKLRSKKLSNFDLDRQLYEAINEFNKIKEENPELKNSEAFIKIDLGISESESEIVASRKYYNDIITDYNRLVRIFPSNIVAAVCGYKQRLYFDGKDMNDDNINDFKL